MGNIFKTAIIAAIIVLLVIVGISYLGGKYERALPMPPKTNPIMPNQ